MNRRKEHDDTREPKPGARTRPISSENAGVGGSTFELNAAIFKSPEATMLVRVTNDRMRSIGIEEGDVVIADRTLKALEGDTVITLVGGEHIIRRVVAHGDRLFLEDDDITDGEQIVPVDYHTDFVRVVAVGTHIIRIAPE